ncbi:hypothetical protein BN1723_016467 [Verticillium longisporum]|uniref:Uncharacterized protein n=1 Tax=Verticillium longisporum TaxID=100787 RepID=A0A0G4MWJ2_VERLO|nr:hypothetical protein HYQ44_003527 [Verticillium longisporum]KAG7151006.1 hypothetical protein HYQ46_000009 [Verticillium longisporum]CRK38583.1 hypothetical protein BN1708_016648 [Verticillium longisporum]CRK45097.1 hypothetical protein BN1723_016467 [Verticillium longisporum]
MDTPDKPSNKPTVAAEAKSHDKPSQENQSQALASVSCEDTKGFCAFQRALTDAEKAPGVAGAIEIATRRLPTRSKPNEEPLVTQVPAGRAYRSASNPEKSKAGTKPETSEENWEFIKHFVDHR